MLSSESYTAIYHSPLGTLGIQIDQDKLSHIDWLANSQTYAIDDTSRSKNIIKALDCYFSEGKWDKKIKIQIEGTNFQKRVWNALQNIPSGETKTYGDLAKELNTSSRAIGQACKRNPVPIFIPCHRVVARDHIGGFMGKEKKIHIKEWLLDHEAKHMFEAGH